MGKLLKQIAKFGVVGIICFGIDYGLMVLLTEAGRLDYLFSSGISFSVSVAVNYLLSMRFVFTPKKENNRAKEFVVFVVLSIAGLLLTEILMWLGVEKLNFHYTLSKIAATGIVLLFNFTTKKNFLEQKEKAEK